MHLSLPEWFPLLCLFWLPRLQVCLVSNFCPDTRGQGWSLIQAHLFSCVVGREEHCKQISLVCVGSACSVWATLGLPQLTVACAFWVYTTQTPGYYAGHCPKQTVHFVHFRGLSHSGSGFWVLHKGIDSFGHAFCAFSRSEQLRRSGAW